MHYFDAVWLCCKLYDQYKNNCEQHSTFLTSSGKVATALGLVWGGVVRDAG